MLTVHILTKNNAKTITRALDSVQAHADRILVGDLGSQDETVSICEQMGAEVLRVSLPRHKARNTLIAESPDGLNLMLEPWEAVMHGLSDVQPGLATVIEQKIVTKEARVWAGSSQFVGPVYEHLPDVNNDSGLVIYSNGRSDHDDLLKEIEQWKLSHPMDSLPYYYEACLWLSKGKWDRFLPLAEHYMFLDKTYSMPATMIRYYYAMAQVVHVKKLQPAMQNVSICMAAKPLMAEFWCLAGDIHYHLNRRFELAKGFYENAIFLGGRRLKNDKWPMDLTKYKSYPLKMIDSCNNILGGTAFYSPRSSK